MLLTVDPRLLRGGGAFLGLGCDHAGGVPAAFASTGTSRQAGFCRCGSPLAVRRRISCYGRPVWHGTGNMRLEALLAASAADTPQAIAALQPDGLSITYADLDAYASAIARRLADAGVGAGDRVGLCIPKTIAALASVFGILRAGAAYVPVDVSAPAARNSYIFDDCDVAAIIVDAAAEDELTAALAGSDWTRVNFPSPEGYSAKFAILARSGEAQRRFAPRPDLAYILYTSG